MKRAIDRADRHFGQIRDAMDSNLLFHLKIRYICAPNVLSIVREALIVLAAVGKSDPRPAWAQIGSVAWPGRFSGDRSYRNALGKLTRRHDVIPGSVIDHIKQPSPN
jgi:hypothetical protein